MAKDIKQIIESKFKDYEFLKKHFCSIYEKSQNDFSCAPRSKTISLNTTLTNKFDIQPGCFQEHFERQVSGNGNEATKIYSIESSSRLALLSFYSLCDRKPLIINGIKYTSCYFEVKNKVITFPSNIDIMLVSEDKQTLFYLESKYTEYIQSAVKHEIEKRKDDEILGKSYFQKHEVLMNSLRKFVDDQTGEIRIEEPLVDHEYRGGIKQMISHFIGVCQGPSEQDKNYSELKSLWENANQIFLGSILYDFNEDNGDSSYLNSYKKLHKELADILNDPKLGVKKDEIRVVEEPFTYQNIFQAYPNVLNDKVAEFYHLGKYDK